MEMKVLSGALFLVMLLSVFYALPVVAQNQSVAKFKVNGCFSGPRPYYDVTCWGASGSGAITTGSIRAASASLSLASAQDFQNGQGLAIYGAGPVSSLPAPGSLAVSQVVAMPPIDLAAGWYNGQGAICSGTTATITTRGWHGLTTGESVTITNVRSSAGSVLRQYNITATIRVMNQYVFTYSITSCPGNGGSLSMANLASIVLNAGTTSYAYEVVAVDVNNGASAASSPVTISNVNPFVTYQDEVYISLSWAQVSGATMYAVYRKVGTGRYSCIGPANQPGQSGIPATFSDYGQTNSCPQNVPTNPPRSATNGILITSIVSGGSTTTLTLNNSAATAVSGAAVQHDDTAAINAAIAAAAANALPNPRYGYIPVGGGHVLLPNGIYFTQTLRFPTTTPFGGASMVVTLDGAINTRQPITLDYVGNYRIEGGTGGFGNGNLFSGQSALITGAGTAPLIHLIAAIGDELSNLGVYFCSGDCILSDTSAYSTAGVTLDNVSASTAAVGGYPFNCANYGNVGLTSNYDYVFKGGNYSQVQGLGPASMRFEDCTQIKSYGGTGLDAGGVLFQHLSKDSVEIGIDWNGAGTFPEQVHSPLFTFDERSSPAGAAGITVQHVDRSDDLPGIDRALIKVLGSGYISGVTLLANYDDWLTEGNAYGVFEQCTSGDSGCGSPPGGRQGYAAPGSGLYMDNKGQMSVYTIPNYPNAISIGGHVSQITAGTWSGTCTLGTNCTITFSSAYASAPACIGTDQTAANPVKSSPATTGVTFTGTGTDVIAWACFGNPN
jgi:hypothetical protein